MAKIFQKYINRPKSKFIFTFLFGEVHFTHFPSELQISDATNPGHHSRICQRHVRALSLSLLFILIPLFQHLVLRKREMGGGFQTSKLLAVSSISSYRICAGHVQPIRVVCRINLDSRASRREDFETRNPPISMDNFQNYSDENS